MPVIVFSSPKGGAGKTTAAVILATELAGTGATVTVIDADPNKNVVDWSKLPDAPKNLSVIGEVSEDTIQDQIDEAARTSTFVVVDLEGTASLLVGYAIAAADLVVIPVQGSQLDAKQAARTIKLIKAQERGRAKIPFAILFTRTNPAIVPRTQRHIEERMIEMEVPAFSTRLADREAYRAIFSYGGTLQNLSDKGMSNLPTAITNARSFVAEALQLLKQGAEQQSASREVA
ncbi:MAG: ParA family protein [Alphaproteobacteria bacterium]|nr:ParA family protein [Alphaproteobacteria bacterium]